MKFKGINKAFAGKFITFYKAEYETEKGNTKVYEMVSQVRCGYPDNHFG